MAFKAWFFPQESRFLPGQRWMNVLFRTTHLVGLGGLGAGFLYPAVDQSWQLYLYLTLISGVGLSLISIYSNGIWLFQLRGQAVFVKLLLLALISPFPELKAELFILIILISGWIAHAPARIRYYSLYHRRRIESLD
ncbi:hypothetical protein [Sedimenticola selenatireducens]|jgi:hypothetical protein|uniref:Uncharacterized protein n=1 Tax=Sedimenticola selenatireducens TaxID=191960 RepID=A0A558DMY0_9GAMM|nr:hypothetical protein [Sedimenticola selenatireducens]TVO74836.1 hypothetical protein FHP88_10085 [Sedimenticola selenatireducens]TVT62371.1 MAG: hypothetical protein FHK78_14650 [Sedimenticola selenatireducens]